MKDDLRLIREAAATAGRIALKHFGRDPDVWHKENDSPVSEADFAVDEFLKTELLAARPDYGWLSEETEADPARFSRRRCFVVDPIDGTRAFLAGKKTWCVSIAIVEEGVPLVGVLDCPAIGEIFEATRGDGAYCNGSALKRQERQPPFSIAGPASMLREMPGSLLQTNRAQKHIPSLAYRIAMVADGRLDATFIKTNSHDWDIAAALLMLKETGGQVLTPDGSEATIGRSASSHGPLLACQNHLIEQLLPVLKAVANKRS
ncbi:3'(2'),5'-bisphosphate nucleotidase CysQ [Notoacmeibacter ruber]|uniref:3'(2'),5'-bisphosphate nucleotidase CysQ n=1 Tax=Notoacmeibacter ruber TaxID=2670375 RepID=UPI001FE1FE8A|nr:3'(2'),5'-bisphosphate nucleotidase CysQ [Notoacmeibacter ruber]